MRVFVTDTDANDYITPVADRATKLNAIKCYQLPRPKAAAAGNDRSVYARNSDVNGGNRLRNALALLTVIDQLIQMNHLIIECCAVQPNVS